jgi:hypothetical protein
LPAIPVAVKNSLSKCSATAKIPYNMLSNAQIKILDEDSAVFSNLFEGNGTKE